MLKRIALWSFFICLAPAGVFASIYQTASPYTDTQGDSIGSVNGGRDIVGATITNNATYLYITVEVNPTACSNTSSGVTGTGNNETAANIATSSYDYLMGITMTGVTGATSANGTLENAYGRAISIDSGLGGMTDMIGMFGLGTPSFTTEGFNDYVWSGTAWTVKSNVNTVTAANAQGDSLYASGGDTTDNTFTVVVPIADFTNLGLTTGSTFDFDIYSSGTSGNQTAYDALANSSPTETGTYNATSNFNDLTLDSYTIQAVPEPASIGLFGIMSLSLMKRFRLSEKSQK